ncbi:WD40-repeat-containing domain protein [Ganoderma leucocontextum]|nr:WD40-repeat-containing domain protein [Ganoderma leucocontextum]
MQSPRLPLEVIERVIGHSGDHRSTIHNFSLTCSDLRPRSLCFLVTDAEFQSRDQIFDFCDFLRAKPHLKCFVRSITVHPNHLAPVPLLKDLPNLSDFTFADSWLKRVDSYRDLPATLLHQSTLTSCHLLGMHIQTLRLSDLLFATPLAFVRALSAFPNIVHLACKDVFILQMKDHRSRVPLEVMRQHSRPGRVRLQTLTIDISTTGIRHYGHPGRQLQGAKCAGELLLNWGWGLSTTESLTVKDFHTGHDGWLGALVASPDSVWVASGSIDGTIILWDIANGDLARRWPMPNYLMVRSLVFSPDSRYLFPVTQTVLKGHTGPVQSCAWSSSDDVIATGSSGDKTIRLWDAHIFQLLSVFADTRHNFNFNLMFSPTGRALLSMCSRLYCTWDVASRIPDAPVWCLDLGNMNYTYPLIAAFNSESRHLLCVAFRGRTPKILDIETGAELVLVNFGTSEAEVGVAAFSSDGKLLATGLQDGTMKIWDAYTGVELLLLKGHTESVWSADFSPCGRYVASMSMDHTPRESSAQARRTRTPSSAGLTIFVPLRAGLLVGGRSEQRPDALREPRRVVLG